MNVESTELFAGTEDDPLQIVRVTGAPPGEVTVRGPGVATAFTRGDEVAVRTSHPAGARVPLEVLVNGAPTGGTGELVVAEPGWTVHMIPHFHYDPVWWNTQAAYTSEWDRTDEPGSPRLDFQRAGFDLVRAHLAAAEHDPDYRFVLAEVDYLKPYWDTFPEDRATIRDLLRRDRLEIVGGTWNEPNGNLTSAELTARNVVYGTGFQRDIMGADPATAWQLDVFGHDPQFPGMMADAGLTSSSWARGPFHQWGPMLTRIGSWDDPPTDPDGMQFPSEFEWLSPSGRGVLTAYMTNHYSAGWWMDYAPTLEAACDAVYRIFLQLKQVAATKHVLLPVGADYSPPNRWVTRIHRDWPTRYVWPRLQCSLPKDFFAAVRATPGFSPSPQTRDMNPVYTGKDVSYIDTKQAHRAAELLTQDAEQWATFAGLLGAPYPETVLDVAWRQLVYGAHHDAITGTESDQVYLDLLAGWREAHTLAGAVHDGALQHIADRVDGGGRSVTVFNPSAWPRTDLVDVATPGVRPVDDGGVPLPCLSYPGGVRFLARDVPSLGYRTWRLVPGDADRWTAAAGTEIANEHHVVSVDPDRGGAIDRIHSVAEGRDLLAPGRVANELVVYDEYVEQPVFKEGPWHLLPNGRVAGSAAAPAGSVLRETSPLGERLTVTGTVGPAAYTQQITLWHGVDRVDCTTHLDRWDGTDQLLRVRFPLPVGGGRPVYEVGDAVIGRGFGFPDVDTAEHPWTLDNPAYTWFGAGSTARIRVTDPSTGRRTLHAVGVADVVVPALDDAAPLARDLLIALARVGVTATTSVAAGARYGLLAVDSNLPDFRIAVGGPSSNPFTAAVLDAAPSYFRELLTGQHLVWVPAARPLREVWTPTGDLTGVRDLPVLIVAGGLSDLVADCADAVIDVVQPTTDAGLEDRTVALLNRGIPGCCVDVDGTLHLSLLRSCTGWPSGVWIDPPRRTTPDGTGFQLQHWTHTFEYALVTGAGDWRDNDLVRRGHAFNHPLRAVTTDGAGDLPAVASLLSVEPPGAAVVTAVKPTGNPLATGRIPGPRSTVTVRLYEPNGRAADVTLGRPMSRTDLLEGPGVPVPVLRLRGAEIATVTVDLGGPIVPAPVGDDVVSDARSWLTNRGVPAGGALPFSVHLDDAGTATVTSDLVEDTITATVALGETTHTVTVPPLGAATVPGPALAVRATVPGLGTVTDVRTGQPAFEVDLDTDDIVVPAGGTATLDVRVLPATDLPFGVELQPLGPPEIWAWTTIVAGTVVIRPPAHQRPGTWWLLVKALGGGTPVYSPTVRITVT
ncbi:glycoside hydrolase family 38 C-terminal domain-containing protein [Dactylosporangium siamense]|uniref:Alpha-mannosidase n=1 Tax=Dactylosporangium siamense TaxID=685454 RepID=A0A919PJS8_9ACTN|nr:glycoside hydrolase family 38 C-terminal domain-containing protein [Dactylosporangium siamense]GIG45019.1 alpha-mannosidase [Dactylosporangium siamense]